MFVRLLVLTVVALTLWALFARESGASGPEQRYRVQAGDTLWSIAVEQVGGDPRRAVWELQQRNGLDGALIVPGQILSLPS